MYVFVIRQLQLRMFFTCKHSLLSFVNNPKSKMHVNSVIISFGYFFRRRFILRTHSTFFPFFQHSSVHQFSNISIPRSLFANSAIFHFLTGRPVRIICLYHNFWNNKFDENRINLYIPHRLFKYTEDEDSTEELLCCSSLPKLTITTFKR